MGDTVTDETSAADLVKTFVDLTRDGGFSDIDASGALDAAVANLDFSESLPHLMQVRERTYELLSANSGDVVVDVGCGTGTVVGELVTRGLKAIGVDHSAQMVAVAQRRHPDLDLRVASAESLPFADGEVAGYRAERVYEHVADPAACAAEAHRVIRSGGRLVLTEQDWDAIVIDADDHELTRRILRGFADSIANPWIGRRYRKLLLDAGFDDVAVEVMTVIYTEPAISAMAPAFPQPAVAAGLITQTEADDWVAEQLHRAEQGRFFIAMPMFIASTRRP
jgi:ubiquinone/menaquinone biosynthesis C-methylase UbiE